MDVQREQESDDEPCIGWDVLLMVVSSTVTGKCFGLWYGVCLNALIYCTRFLLHVPRRVIASRGSMLYPAHPRTCVYSSESAVLRQEGR
eukprot:1967196-Rhodomonas_salina.2